MKSLFKLSIKEPLNGSILAVQAGYKHIAFSISGKSPAELYGVHYFSVDDWNPDTISLLMEKLPEATVAFGGIEIAYDTGEFSLIPVVGFDEAKLRNMHEVIHPFRNDTIFKSESIAAWQLYMGYRVPALLSNALEQRYPEARIRHALNLMLQKVGSVGMQGSLLINFRQDQFTVVLLRNNKLQLAQAYDYSQPADILYQLLKICQEQVLSQQEVVLSITGLLDRESSLFRELQQYFQWVSCREASWINGESTFPSHYFTSLNDLASCV